MAKSRRDEPGLFTETTAILALLSRECEQDIVVLAVPSHNKRNGKLPESVTSEWASAAVKLMTDLYGGATAFVAMKGGFKTDEGHYLEDTPVIVESYAHLDAIHDPSRLNLLVDFAKRMGKTLDQASVMLAFGNYMFYVADFGDA